MLTGEASCRCSPANAYEVPLVHWIERASMVLRCWPIRTRRLRTQGHQRTNSVPCWDAKVLECVLVVDCAVNVRGLASSFAHDWATASMFHVSASVLVHSLLRVARTAKESDLMRWPAVPVVCSDCRRDDRQRAPNPLFQTFAHTAVGQEASLASATAEHTHHQLASLIDRRTLATRALDSLGLPSFGCSVGPTRFNASFVCYFWNCGLKISIALVIVAGSIVDIPLLAYGPTRRAILLHAALKGVTNERSVVPQCSQASVAHTWRNAVLELGDSLPDNDAGLDAWQSNQCK
jgi:hypothetical protein